MFPRCAECRVARGGRSSGRDGLAFSPGAGVDIATGERAAIRVSGGVSIGVIEGETATSFGVGVGTVFGVESR